MRQWLPCVLLVGLGIVLAGGLVLPGTAQVPPPREQPRVPPDVQAASLLHQAYDDLGLVHVWMSSDRAKLPDDQTKLVDQAEEFYRSAHRAYKDRDYARAAALATATGDASRGLMSVLHANTKPVAGLPVPPDIPAPDPAAGAGAIRGPQDAARELLGAARERIVAAEKATAGQGPARSFVDASRPVYEQGRQAYEDGKYAKAMDLAAAAEAWAQVSNDLRRAEGGDRPGTPRPER